MATNIEQIFRSFVISKFREIQDQQFVGRKSGSQHNGEINSPDRVEPSDDTIPSIGNLQVDPLVQKIEQVLSEVLSAESQYKPDVGENILRSKSAKRSLSEEVQDEIPRKKSKKEKKHKEKKKKKKRKKDKKDKKYKKQSKESKPNAQEKEHGELQPITHSESENSLAILSVEDDMDMQLTPTVTQTSVWMQEKPVYVNKAVSNSYDTDSDRNRSDVSKEHSASVSIHESTKAEVVHERELENGPYQPTNLAVDLLTEDASLKITDTGDGGVCMIRSGTPSIEETGVSSALAATEKVNVPKNRSLIARAEQEHLDTSLESAMLEAKRSDSVTESLNTENMKQSVSVSSEIYPQPPLETPAEAKDSVTALGFLAMVVGKDFEATSEFLNTAKVKASERSPKHISDMKKDVISDFERLVPQDLQKTLQVNSRAEFKDLPSSESQHGAFEKDSEPISVTKPKLQEEELKRTAESGAQKCMTMVSDGETVTGMRQLRETLVSEIMTELKDSGKSPRSLQTITDGKDIRRTTDLQLTNRKYLSASVPDRTIEAENTAPAPLAIMGARNLEPSAACEKTVQMKCLEPFIEAVIEKKRVIEVNVPESIPRLEDVAEMNDLETISETADSVKPQNLEISKCINLQEVENEGVVNLKDLKKGSESPVTMKNVESIPQSQHVKYVLQSTTVAQKNDFQTSLELEGEKKEKDIDAASDSLHMIFTNYSEHSLEPYTEPTVELKNSERVPELLVRADTNSRKEQHIRESKELTSIESELNDELNDLQKIECLHRNKRNVKEAMESKAAPTGKDSDTLEAVPKGGQVDTIPHFVAGIEEKVSDICESMEKNQHDAEADLHELSRCQKITKKSSERSGESMLFAESKSLFTSESLQEMNILRSGMAPKLKTVGPMQGLKEIVGFAAGMEVISPEKKLDVKISESSGSKDYSKFISTVKQVEPVVESHAEQNIEPLQQTNKNTKNINLGIMCDFDIKHDNANAEKWFSVELNNQKEKQTLEARSETAGRTTVPKLLYGSAKDPVIVSETDEINRVIVSECHPDPVRLGKINSENIVKPLYLIQMKDSQTISESRIVDVKALETDSGATFKAGAASADLQEGELKVSSEIETTSESPKKNEISLGLQSVLVLQEPDKAFRNKALAFTNLDAPSETHRTCNTENLEIPPQREELEVKKPEGALPFVFVVDMVEGTTDKGKLDADTATERVLTTEKSRAPTESADMLGKTFEPTCMTNLKYLEASQKLKTHLESLDRKEMNYVFSGSSTVMNASETLKNEGRHVLDNVWKDTNKVKEKHSGTDLEPDAALVVKNSESVLESITDSGKKDGDTSMTAVKVTDLETSSSNLDTTQTSNLKTTVQIEMTSKPVCTLQTRDSDSVIESVSKTKTKDLGQAVNAEKILQVKDSVTATEQLNTLELKSLALTSGPEVTDCAEIPDLKTTPRYLVAAHSTCSSTVAEMKALEAVDSGTHLKPENTSKVNLSETTLEIDKERHDYVAVSRSEAMIEEASEPVSEVVCLSNVEDLKSTSEPKHVEIVQSSEKPLQLLFKSKCSAVTVESAKMSDLQNTSADVDPISFTGEKYPKTASEIVSPAGVKNSKPSSEVIVALNDKELFLKSGNILQFADSVESKDFEAANKCVTLEEVGDLQVASVSTGEEVQMVSEGTSKTMLDLESQKLEQSSTSEVLGKNLTEVTVESSHAVCTKDSEPVPEHISAKNIDISEQHSKCLSIREVKDIDASAKYVILTEAKFLEVIPQFIGKMKDSETTLEQLITAKEKDLGGIPHVSLDEEGLKTAAKPVCTAIQNLEANEQLSFVLKDLEPECVQRSEKDLKASEKVFLDAKDSEPTIESLQKEKDRNLKATVEDSLKDHDSEAASKSLDITKEDEESTLKDKKSEKISSKTKDKSKSGKKAKKSRSKSLSKSKKHKKKTRSRSVSRLVSSRRARSRSKNDSDSKKKHSTSRHKSRSKSTDRKEKESSLRSKRRRSRSPDRLKSRSKSVDKREISVRSRRRRSKSSDHRKSRSRSVDRRESVRRRRRLSRSSDNHRSRSRSVDRRETLIRSRRRRSRSSDRKSRSQSADRREISVRRKQRRSLSSDRCKSRSRSLDRRESSIRTRRRRSRSSDHHKSRSRSADDKRESPVRTRRRRSRSPDTRKSRSRSFDRRARRRRSRSSDNRKSRSRSADRRETSVRVRRRRSRSSDNRRSKSKSVDKRETPLRARRRRSRSSDNRRSKSKSIDRKETPVRPRRRRSVSSDRKSRSKSVDKRETSVRAKRRRSKSPDGKSGTKSVEKGEPPLKTRRRSSKSSDHHVSRSKSRSSERKKDKDSSDGSREKHTKYRSKSKSLEKTERTESVEATLHNRSKSPEQHKSKSRSRSKSIDKTGENQSLRRSRSKSSKSPETRSHRRRTVSRSRRNRSRSLTRKRASRSKSNHRSRTHSRTRSRSCSRRWRRTRSRSASRQRSLSRERRRRSRRNRSRSVDRRRRRSDSRDSYRLSLRLRSRSRTPVRLRCSRSIGRRRSPSKSPDHRRSSSRSPKRLTDLDKAQLLEIAKANAAAMCAKAGVPLPPSLMPVVTPEKKEEKVAQKSAKETILELTEKCKKIAQSQDDVIVNKPHVSDEEEEEHPFINHPFKLNEPKPIFFNLTTPTIKPAAPKNQVTLTKEFPVSSGSQHRKKEADSAYGEWVPVEKNKDEKKDDVFPNPANLEPVDISSALTERTIAQKRLTENTFDLEAMCLLNRAQERIDAWAELNTIPGHFTGSTGAQVLTSEQLANSGPQAWVKKDQFLRAAPVSGGMGAQLMRKMGWREGEGLGKNKEGNKEPILVDFKTDRKGLVAIGERMQKRHGPFGAVKDLSGKHPVSALLEVCNKRRWSPPVFVLVNDSRPEYRKHFLFKVMVNGVEYKPSFVSPNKKHAKATAATVALQALGLVPKDLLANATNFRSASHS